MRTSHRSHVRINKHQRKIDPERAVGWLAPPSFYDFTSAFKDKERFARDMAVNDKERVLFALMCALDMSPFFLISVFQPMQTERRLNPA